jgi:hypothetical protein
MTQPADRMIEAGGWLRTQHVDCQAYGILDVPAAEMAYPPQRRDIR